MKNVTISMDEDLARWVRVEAARQDASVSRWIAEVLEERRKANRTEYESAFREWKARGAWIHKEPGTRYPTRDEIYDR